MKVAIILFFFSTLGLSVFLNTRVLAIDDSHYDFRETTDNQLPDDMVRSEETKGFVQELMNIFGLDSFNDGTSSITDYIIFVINIFLGLAAFIALLRIIYGFYRMFFSSHDDGISQARDIVKGAAIALVVIGLSWIIVRFIFRVVGLFTG